jgi:uncharacterized membrane protein/thiol-disulfide isomerase/thioredoxin
LRIGSIVKHLVTALLIGLLVGCGVSAVAQEAASPPITVRFFWAIGCQYCAQEELFLTDLAKRYPLEVLDYEVKNNAENRALLTQLTEQHGITAGNVPVTIIDEYVWQGYNSQISASIEKVVAALSAGIPVTIDATNTDLVNQVDLPWGGVFDLEQRSLWVVTLIIGFIDGINPCSLWVLTLLLSIVLNSGSRRKSLIVGGTFLLTTTLVYGLALVGLVNAFAYLGYVRWLQMGVAAIAIIWGAINIKDFFWYKKGVSLTISDKHKPGIYRNIRQIMQEEKLLPLIGITLFMAAGVSLAELPCTAGFPIIWSNIIASSGVSTLTYLALLGLYLLVFLLDELVVFIAAVITLRTSRLQEVQGRQLKLIGGVVMLVLGLVMVFDPEIMTRLVDSAFLFAGALLLAWMINTAYTAWLAYRDEKNKKRMTEVSILAYLATLLAQAGLLGSMYIAWDWSANHASACSITVSSCITIATSIYAYLMNIPIAYLSLGFYAFVLLAITAGQKQLTRSDAGGSWLQGLLLVLLLVKMLYSAYLTWVSVALLGAFSVVCLTFTLIALVLFMLVLQLGKAGEAAN